MYDTEDFAPQEWEYYNPNPTERMVGDCAVRAVSKAVDIDWEKAYTLIMLNGYQR